MLKQYKLRNYHFQLVISILVLNIIGILIIGSAKHSVQKMQILGCIIGMVAMVIVSLMDYSFILRFTWLYYIGIIVLLGLVMTGIGDSAGGAQRWIDFGGFRFQPSELAKIVLILFFARFFSKHAENLNTVKTIGLSFANYLKHAFLFFLMSLCASVAGLHPVLLVCGSALYMFGITLLNSDPYLPRNFFMLGMGFLLLEIYPIGIQEIPIRLGATVFAIACTTAFIYAMKAVKKESEIARDRRFIMRAFDDIGFQLIDNG